MNKHRPYCLSIAGFDPSGGAGVLADVKTFEAHKVLGFGVITGLTFQNDSEFAGVKWMEADEIIKKIETLTRKFKFEFVKIGMVKNIESLEIIISNLMSNVSHLKLILDPVMKASSGFQIHASFEREKLISVLKNIFLITPNMEEIKILYGEDDEMTGAKKLSKYCNVFLKGGHAGKVKREESQKLVVSEAELSKERKMKLGRDFLFTKDGKEFSFRAKHISSFPKHGSGCVLSSAITANLALGNNLHRSCLKGKNYVTKFLMSNKNLLGYHKI